jgi:small subunit ribosomal protein S16
LAVRLRLRRVGRKKLPIYKVVAADARSPRDGRFIESVGQYEPLRTSNIVQFKEDRVIYWLKNGAQPTATVKNLLQKEGIWLKWSLLRRGKDETAISKELEKFSLQKAERDQKSAGKAAGKKKVKDAQSAESAPETIETTAVPAPESDVIAGETNKAEQEQQGN